MFGKYELENEENNKQLKFERNILITGFIIGIIIFVVIVIL